MNTSKERRQTERQNAEATGWISFGQDPFGCRVIDLSENGAQVRIDGLRASRNLMGKRASLKLEALSSDGSALEGRVVWVRPAVNGVYLGLEILRREKVATPPPPNDGQ